MNNSWDSQYLNLVEKVLDKGDFVPCRTGDNVKKILNASLTHDLSEGFPILTFRPLPFKGCRVELQGFINGITDKKWYQDNGCKYWNSWANPTKAKTKEEMLNERDLGPIYGFQWRHFGAEYIDYTTDYNGKGVDQLKNVIDTLKTNPYDRRMIINSWNPSELFKMALPPCIYSFQFTYLNNKLNLTVLQRSADLILGVPTDVMSFALLLHLVANTVNMKPGKLCLNMADCHIYENHIESIKANLNRPQFALPTLELNCNNIFDFKWSDANLINYQHGEKLNFEVAV